MESAAVGVPDERLGELVTAFVVPKPAWKGGKLTGEELIEVSKKRSVHLSIGPFFPEFLYEK